MYGPLDSTDQVAKVTAMLEEGDETVKIEFSGQTWK